MHRLSLCYLVTFAMSGLSVLPSISIGYFRDEVMRSSAAQHDLLHADTLVVGCLTAAISKMRVKQIMTTHLG